MPRVTAIRLEALPDPSLPKGGPGRDPYGNFQMNGFEVDAGGRRLGHGRMRKARVRADESPTAARAWTRFSRKRCRATRTRREDGGSTRAVRTSGCRGKSSSRSTSWPAGSEARSRERRGLRIRLKHQGAVVGQSLGRFRLSVTSSSTPQRVVEIPARLRPILAIAAAERTEQQRKDLAAFYRTVATR